MHTRSTETERPWWGAVLVIVYTLLVCAALIVAAVSRPLTDHGFVYELGRSFALAGLGILALQSVLSARVLWVERPFGLDALMGYHKVMSGIALALIASHPVLLALGGAGWGLIYRTDSPWYIWFGKVALLLLVVQVFTSLFRRTIRLEFERWRLLHNQAAVMVGIAFVHARVTGGDFQETAMLALWWAMLAIAVVAYGYHKFVQPARARRRAYRVAEVRQETHNVWNLRLEPPAGEKHFDFRPGQFHFLTLFREGRELPVEEHPFTISSIPSDASLASTIKESGDFTATIGRTEVGDRAAVEGPYGRFSHTLRPEEKDLVFVAGGIGITPLMSMLRHMRDRQLDTKVLLLYGNRTEGDIVFREELESMAAGGSPQLRVVHVLSEAADGWPGEKGYVDREKLERLVDGEYGAKMYYVCGPPPMMSMVVSALRDIGVPSARIEYERFSL